MVICFFGLLNAFSMRNCLSMAITKMVPPLNHTTKELIDDTCPENIYHLQYENKTVIERKLFDWTESTQVAYLESYQIIMIHNNSLKLILQGIILSSFYWSYIISNFLSGSITDKFGGKQTLGLSTLVVAVLTILTPATVTWGGSTSLIILRIIMGLSQGVTYPALSVLIAQWIPANERSKAGSVVFAGSSFGTIFGMTLSGIILQHSKVGWPMVFYFFGGIGVASYILTAVFVYDKPTNHPYISDEEANYLKEKLSKFYSSYKFFLFLKICEFIFSILKNYSCLILDVHICYFLSTVNNHSNLPPTPWKHILKSVPVWALIIVSFGRSWAVLTMATDMPKFLNNVLKFSVQNNGFFSSAPYLLMWMVSVTTSWIADYTIAKEIASITLVRKIGSSLASFGAGAFIISAAYAGCDGILVVAFITVGLGLIGCATFSSLINHLDLSPNYAGSLMGFTNGVATTGSTISPYLVGLITPNQTVSEWRLVFWIVFAFLVGGNTVFLVYGSGDVQPWNNPAFISRKRRKRSGRGSFKEVVQVLPTKSNCLKSLDSY